MKNSDRVIAPMIKIWTRPVLDVTAIKLAKYYHVSRTDQGNAEHRS